MPLQTNLNRAPWNDTYSGSQDYYRVAIKPGVSIQARELNELQSMFAAQVERFGDSIFQTGTIVSGCNFLFLSTYPYVKLQDQDAFGGPVTPSAYVNNAILNETTGLRAQVLDFADGFVSNDPDLKTLYVNYINTGFDANTTAFSAGDTLTVYDPIRNGIERVLVNGGGQGFSNTDHLFAVSALAVTPVSGTLANGQYIVNGLGANVQIVGIDTTTLAAAGQLILSVAPRAADLANASVNSSAWTIANGQSFTNSGNTASAVVAGVIGSGYAGLAVTDSLGSIQEIVTLNKGVGYSSLPYVTLRSTNNVSGFSTLDLSPQNFVAKLKVATTSSPVGSGYAFGVNEGVVYLRGTFLRVSPQTVIVSKYDQVPDGVSVCFTATETIVDADVDPSLNDPAAGENNGAPGADRLKVVPQLSIVSTPNAESNSQVLSLVNWNLGNPYIQKPQSQYSAIGDAMAQNVYDQSGDFYIDPFLVTTATASLIANSVPGLPYYTFDTVVDAGSAYVSGRKVQTDTSYIINTPFQFNSVVRPNWEVSLNYGNYLVIKEVGGTFQFNTGDQIQLYSSTKGYVSNSSLVKAANTTPQGTQLGTAQIRNMQLVSGTPGTNTAIYNLYVFDVQMNAGANFSNVRSVYYNGTKKGIADVVLARNSLGTNVATTLLPKQSQLVWFSGYSSIKNSNAASYQFSSLDQTVTIANSGVLTKSLATAGQTYPWAGANLINTQLNQIYLAPTAIDLVSSANTSGSWVTSSGSANVAANTGTAALTDLIAGDWLTFTGNTTQTDLKQVIQVVNNTFIILDSAPSFTNTAALAFRTYPKNLPINLNRTGVSANVSSNGTVLTINAGFAVNTATAQAMVIGVPVLVSNVTPTTKTVNRNAFIKICVANNAGGQVGPWSMGVPDVFRLRGVYVGNSTVSNTETNYASMFSVDNNQNLDFLDLSWLYLDNKINSPITSGSYILVQFDYYTTTGSGYYVPVSYTHTTNTTQLLINDGFPLANLTSDASTWEIPEFFTNSGQEVDLLGCLDFRPYAQTTATPGSNSSNAPLNPGNTTTFASTEKMFPVPGTLFTSTMDFFAPRMDAIFIDKTGKIDRVQGKTLVGKGTSPTIPAGAMKIADMFIPEYPNLPANRSSGLTGVINTGVINTRFIANRTTGHAITLVSTITQDAARSYTNKDVADIDQRLKNVEYYVSLNTLENSVKSLIIPSSSDPSVNRYQFGFFADDFSTSNLSDLTNPGYAATLENGDIVPSKMAWEVYGGDEFSGAQTYIPVPILSQLNATIGTHGDPTAEPQCALALANSVAYQLVYRSAFDFNDQAPIDGTVDTVVFTLADGTHLANTNVTAGGENAPHADQVSQTNLGPTQVTLWFYAYDNPVQFQILQGNTVVADSSSATNLTGTEITNLSTGSSMNQWFNDQTSLFMRNFVTTSGAYVKFAGKVTWDYPGTGSRQLVIRTTNGTGVRNWRWVLSYPINGESAGCVPPPPVTTCPTGYYYDNTQGGCVLIPPPPPPPPVVVCPTGYVLNPSTNQCDVIPPPQGHICPAGQHWDTTLNQCVIDTPITCPTGYQLDPATGTCVLIIVDPKICPPGYRLNTTTNECEIIPVVNIVYNGCGNAIADVVQQVLAAQASGAIIGTITINETFGVESYSGATTRTITGTLADFLDPASIQNEEILESQSHGQGLAGTVGGSGSFAQAYAAATGAKFGTYALDSLSYLPVYTVSGALDHWVPVHGVVYIDPNGNKTSLPFNEDELAVLDLNVIGAQAYLA